MDFLSNLINTNINLYFHIILLRKNKRISPFVYGEENFAFETTKIMHSELDFHIRRKIHNISIS